MSSVLYITVWGTRQLSTERHPEEFRRGFCKFTWRLGSLEHIGGECQNLQWKIYELSRWGYEEPWEIATFNGPERRKEASREKEDNAQRDKWKPRTI